MTVGESHRLAHVVKEDVQRALPKIVEMTIHVDPHWPGGRPADDGPAS
jgi:divalent metal cation (Fe/Co/Zn/Cd) transporter